LGKNGGSKTTRALKQRKRGKRGKKGDQWDHKKKRQPCITQAGREKNKPVQGKGSKRHPVLKQQKMGEGKDWQKGGESFKRNGDDLLGGGGGLALTSKTQRGAWQH